MNTDNSLRLMCWQGYEDTRITYSFKRATGLELEVETLLSDHGAAQILLSDQVQNWDLININNAYIRDYLAPRNIIKPISKNLFDRYLEHIHPVYTDLLPWSYDQQNRPIGIGQRFGPFNLVVNTDSISKVTAQNQGFNLANERSNSKRYAILDYPDFNVFHICIGSQINPFTQLDAADLDTFKATAERWFKNAKIISDNHHHLNQTLANQNIDFYISGGVYTVSPARAAGHTQLMSITPDRGPIYGQGGIAFSEITCSVNQPFAHANAEAFLAYMLEPDTAYNIAFTADTSNPVAQMGDPKVFNKITSQQLEVIQWDDLDEDMSRCAHYQIPPNNLALLQILQQTKEQYS